jgi:hypothetical protein
MRLGAEGEIPTGKRKGLHLGDKASALKLYLVANPSTHTPHVATISGAGQVSGRNLAAGAPGSAACDTGSGRSGTLAISLLVGAGHHLGWERYHQGSTHFTWGRSMVPQLARTAVPAISTR